MHGSQRVSVGHCSQFRDAVTITKSTTFDYH